MWKTVGMSWSIGRWWRADREYREAFRLWRSTKPGEAVKAFDRVIETFPKHARAHAQRALALAAAGNTSEAVRAARQAADLSPKSHVPPLALGRVQYDAGRYEEARKAFAAAAKLDPENKLVQAYLGLALLAMDRLKEGAELLKAHLLYANEGMEGRLLTLAEKYLWERRDQARPLEDQLTLDEGGHDTRPAGFGLRFASALRKVMLLPLAAIRGRKARFSLLAEEAMSVMNLEGAAAALAEAGKAGADPEWVAISLAGIHMQMKKPQAAMEQLSKLPKEAWEDPGLAALIGEALFEAGRYAEAREPLTLAATHFTREFAPSYYRGLVEIALGQPQNATPWFTQACERLNPHIAEKRLAEMLRVAQG
jgi:tetratricopeptide (TPR) repeat protein